MSVRKMKFQTVWAEARGQIPTLAERDILDAHADELREHLDLEPGREWQWGLIGDNTLCAWHWAEKMEALHGVPTQAALRYVRRTFVPDGTP